VLGCGTIRNIVCINVPFVVIYNSYLQRGIGLTA